MDSVSFGNAESLNGLLRNLEKTKDPARLYSTVKNTLKDSRFILTEDEFKKAIPVAKEVAQKNLEKEEAIWGKGHVHGDPIKDAMLLMKKFFGFNTDY